MHKEYTIVVANRGHLWRLSTSAGGPDDRLSPPPMGTPFPLSLFCRLGFRYQCGGVRSGIPRYIGET